MSDFTLLYPWLCKIGATNRSLLRHVAVDYTHSFALLYPHDTARNSQMGIADKVGHGLCYLGRVGDLHTLEVTFDLYAF